jgi:hypothetical protein
MSEAVESPGQASTRRTRFRVDCRPTGSYPETGLEEINGDLPEADAL